MKKIIEYIKGNGFGEDEFGEKGNLIEFSGDMV